jgi:DNA repair exonuclease SbcCD ATPase subunit
MRIERVKASNFLSWESLDYSFEDKIVAVTGDNKTQEDQASNGSGKSSLQQILYYGIIGSSMKNVLDKKLIRNGESEASTSVTISCAIRRQTMVIDRKILLKGSSKLEIRINNQPCQFANINDGNKLILDWIGISAEDLKSYFLICKEYYKSFYKASNTEKLALISRFINFSFIDKTKDIIDEEIGELNASKRDLEREKAVLEGKLQVYEEALIKEEMRDLEKEKEVEINLVLTSISQEKFDIKGAEVQKEQLETRIQVYEEELKGIQEKLEKQKLKLESLPTTKELDEEIQQVREILSELNEEQKAYLTQKDELFRIKGNIKKEISRIDTLLAGSIKCPKCGHEFLTSRGFSLEKEKGKKEELKKQLIYSEKEEEGVEEALKEYEETISEAIRKKNEIEEEKDKVLQDNRKENSLLQNIEADIRSCREEIKSAQLSIERKDQLILSKLELIKSLEKKIKAIQDRVEEKNTEEIETNIENTAEFIRQKESAIERKNGEIYAKEQWVNRFKDFKRALALEQLKNIQSHTNDLLKKQKSDLRLMLEGFKVGANNKLKEEITPYVLRDEPESFWYYSGGERARVEIATIIAFQMLINATNPHGGLQFLFVDEVLEGLSEEGLYNVIDSLSFLNYPVLIITHVSNQSVKCRALKVEKLNGVSRLV